MKIAYRRLLGPSLALIAGFTILVIALIASQPTKFHGAIGSPGDERFVSGFWEREANASDQFRWTNGASLLRFVGFEASATTLVELDLQGPLQPQPQPFNLSIGDGSSVGDLARPQWRVYQILVPQRRLDWPATVLKISSPTFHPSEIDTRGLGVVLRGAGIVAFGPTMAIPIVIRVVFLLSLIGLCWYLLGVWLGFGRAAFVVPLLAAMLGGISLVRPIGASFWLPQMWATVIFGWSLVGVQRFLAASAARPRSPWIGFAAFALAVLGAVLLAARLAVPLGVTLLVGGALGAALPFAARPITVSRGATAVALTLAVVLALVARLYHLGTLPLGLWQDEARYGKLAVQILQDPSFRPVYVPGGVDYPALLFYLTAFVTRLIGVQPITVRMVAALAGGLTPLALYAFGQRLVGTRATLIAAMLVAGAAWHISISRISFVAVLDPFLVMTGLALLWTALELEPGQPRRWLWFALSGVALGLALYTYHTARLTPLLALMVVTAVLGFSRSRWLAALGGLALAAGIALAIAAPLLQYAWTQSADFNLRLQQTSVLGQSRNAAVSVIAGLNANLQRYLLMWNYAGEPNARHYIPGRPMVDPLVGAALLVGCLLQVRREDRAKWVLLGWFAVEFIPPMLAEGAPHAVRSVGVIAPALLIAGHALDSLWTALGNRVGRLVIPGAVGAALAFNLLLYFGTMPYLPAVWGKFYVPDTEMSLYARSASQQSAAPIYLPRRVLLEDVGGYLTTGLAVQAWDVGESPQLPAGAQVLVPADGSLEELTWAKQWLGPVAPAEPMAPYPGTTNPSFWRYRMP